MGDVFISYSSKDYGEAKMVCDNLENSYIPCWMAAKDIPVNGYYADMIPKAIRKARFFFLIVSKNSMDSEHVVKELELAIESKCKIICYRLDNAPLRDAFNYHLKYAQWIDAENRQTWAIREAVDYIYDQIKTMPEKDLPEQKIMNENAGEIKRIVLRAVLFLFVVIITLAIDRYLMATYRSDGTYLGKTILLFTIAIPVMLLVIAPVFGGKRNMLLHLIDVFREIILSDNKEERKDD